MQKRITKYLFPPLILVLILLEVSCTKSSSSNSTTSTFTKVITSDSSFNNVSSFQLSDGSYIVFGADPQSVRPGLIVKLSSNGTILWEKRMPSSIAKLWKVISVNGNEFAAAGFKSGDPDFNVNVCLFDNDGNLLSSKSNSPGYFPYNNPLDMIQLSNGNYAFSGTLGNSDNGNFYLYLMVTDENFKVLYLNTFQLNQYTICSVGLAQSMDSTINITGFYQNLSASNSFTTFLLRTKTNTVQKSFDTLTNKTETPDCIAANNNFGTIVVSSTSDNGMTLPYKTSIWPAVWGSIGIDNFDSSGHFNSRVTYSGYSNNGLINSIRSTSDGGYILCGTVNQPNNSTAASTTEIFAIKVDAGLNQQWSNIYNASNPPSNGVCAIQTSDGGYLISGQKISFNSHYDMVLIKTDANGNVN